MTKYLITKLAEEGSEVAQAACKHLLKRDARSLANLRGEVADLEAIIELLRPVIGSTTKLVRARVARERKKAKA